MDYFSVQHYTNCVSLDRPTGRSELGRLWTFSSLYFINPPRSAVGKASTIDIAYISRSPLP